MTMVVEEVVVVGFDKTRKGLGSAARVHHRL